MKIKRRCCLVLAVMAFWGSTPLLANGLRVAVWGDNDDRIPDVVTKIQGAGAFTSVDPVNLNTQGVPTLQQAMTYDSILVFDVDTFEELDRHRPSRCSYGTLRRVEFSRGNAIVFGRQDCGFDNDSTQIDWFVPGP